MITIGLPFYNNVATLDSAIKSVFSQSREDWELILVDDGSTDGSSVLAQRIADPRVRVIRDGQNLGLPSRLNQISQLARGEYLARMDADDLMHPRRLEKQLELLESRPDVDVVGSGMVTINELGTPVGLHVPPNNEFDTHRVFKRAVLVHVSVTGRTEWFRANQYDPSFRRSQDRELWVRTHTHSSFYTLEEPLMFVREEGRIAASKYNQNCTARRRILRTYGFESLGTMEVIGLIGQTYLKQLAYSLLSATGKVDVAFSKRNQELTIEQLKSAEATIVSIESTTVPVK